MRMRHGLHCENPSGRGHLEDTWTPAETVKARMLLRLLLTPALAYIPKNRIFAASPATVAWTAQRPASHTGPSVSFTPSPSFVAVVRRGGAWCRQQTQPVTEVVLHCVASRGEGRGERQQSVCIGYERLLVPVPHAMSVDGGPPRDCCTCTWLPGSSAGRGCRNPYYQPAIYIT